jgi:hypothetical protein
MGFLFRLLLLIGLAAVVWRLVRNALAPPPASGAASGARDAQGFEATGRCAKCGTHVPRAQLDAAGICQRCR